MLVMSLNSDERVVKIGTFLYGGEAECDLRIVSRPVQFGTGDYEDEAEVCDDIVQETFYVQYGSSISRGVFNAGGGSFATLHAAISHVEAMPGFGNTVRWIDV